MVFPNHTKTKFLQMLFLCKHIVAEFNSFQCEQIVQHLKNIQQAIEHRLEISHEKENQQLEKCLAAESSLTHVAGNIAETKCIDMKDVETPQLGHAGSHVQFVAMCDL